jgi:hypothetical protein
LALGHEFQDAFVNEILNGPAGSIRQFSELSQNPLFFTILRQPASPKLPKDSTTVRESGLATLPFFPANCPSMEQEIDCKFQSNSSGNRNRPKKYVFKGAIIWPNPR